MRIKKSLEAGAQLCCGVVKLSSGSSCMSGVMDYIWVIQGKYMKTAIRMDLRLYKSSLAVPSHGVTPSKAFEM